MQSKKYLGQHFLKDPAVLEKIISSAELTEDDLILEIGPGTGVLTEALAVRAKKVIAIEKDHTLCELLRKKFIHQKNIEIICGDALRLNPAHHSMAAMHYKVVANIPYYITGRLLRLIGESWPLPQLVVLMLQKEVAERITGKPPHMSLLAASVQWWAEPTISAHVPQTAFSPQPEVDSAILRLQPKKEKRDKKKEKLFFEVVRAGFKQPRKLLTSNLAKEFSREKVVAAMQKLRLSEKIRPAELEIAEWRVLARELVD